MRNFIPSIQTLFSRLLVAFSIVLIASCQSTPTRTAPSEESSDTGGTDKTILVQEEQAPTSGFGGTGVRHYSLPGNYDHALFIGTITGFGSIWVNGVEVEYPKDARVNSGLLDAQATPTALKLGQQVILKTRNQEAPVTSEIEIYYPFAGQVQKTEKNRIQVNNTWINTNEFTHVDKDLNATLGQYITVNAYQAANGEWTATRLNANPKHVTWTLPAMQTHFNVTTRTIVMQRGLSRLLEERQIHTQRLVLRDMAQTAVPLKAYQAQHQKLPPKTEAPQRQMMQQQQQIKQMHQTQQQMQKELIKQQRPSINQIKLNHP
ncbi:MAG: hypothetical protein JXR47_07065 [Thiotrichales bacterium]|nr:hypothetical protein [Thiotrichales bacterium]